MDDRGADTQVADEPASIAVVEGATTGSMAGPVGLLIGIVLGWVVARVARRR